MKHALALALFIFASIANAAPPRFVATWGGELVQWHEPATGHRWTCTYAEFFKYCGKKHPAEKGIKVLGSLPNHQPKPAPQIIAQATTHKPTKAPPAKKTRKPTASQIAAEPLPSLTGLEQVAGLPLLPSTNEGFSVITGQPLRAAWAYAPEDAKEITPDIIEDAPKTKNLLAVSITEKYDVRRGAVITAARLDDVLEGKLSGTGATFIEEARKNNLCPVFLAGVAMHESANGTSKIVRERNNAFGLCPGGSYARYDNIADNIAAAARLLGGKNYAGGSRYTIATIQPRYCPIGDNDPKGLNRHWRSGVVHHMKAFLGETVHVASL